VFVEPQGHQRVRWRGAEQERLYQLRQRHRCWQQKLGAQRAGARYLRRIPRRVVPAKKWLAFLGR